LEKCDDSAHDLCRRASELFFDDVRIPVENLIGEEGQGFRYLMQELPWGRLQLAIVAVAACEAALRWTMKYCSERQAFGRSIASFQNTQFKVAELRTETQIARVFVDRCIGLSLEGKLDVETAAMAKYWTTDLQCKVIDECLQLHGGYGYMRDRCDRPRLRRFPRAAHLRRHQRDQERNHQQDELTLKPRRPQMPATILGKEAPWLTR
jgi:alkylation response protein AidB-like acyl-CoA dehydrogenase